MNLELSGEQKLLRESFAQLFAVESSAARVRAAEPTGFDPGLWKQLAGVGAFGMRVPESCGGSGASLLDACVVAAEAGRRLVSGPLIETMVAARALSACAGDAARDRLRRLLDGSAVVTLVLGEPSARRLLLPHGAVADAALALDGDDLVLLAPKREPRSRPLANLGASAFAEWSEIAERIALASGAPARRLFEAAREEWKVLMSAALAGLAREALEIAAHYASERIQFGRPIGAFQGIAHPLADSAADVEGARLLIWKTIWAIARRRPEAAALVSMSFVWASSAAARAVARALHTHGGYGLSLEYDIQLYHRRAKAWPLAGGDPQAELTAVADRLWGGAAATTTLPDTGDVALDFGLGAEADAFAATVRRFFEQNLTPELRARAHFAWEGHDPGFQRELARAGLLFPSWPREYGGQGRGRYEMAALSQVCLDFGWGRTAINVTDLVGRTVLEFGNEELKQEVLPRIARGDAICCLGYSEPAFGSDVASAKTRAARDGEDWVIDGQKMFTSGADLAQYVFLLTRTNPAVPKHRGLTMFLVPLDSPGIEIQPVETLSDERTNVTYYNGVRVPDRYRVGGLDQGWSVIGHALELEHGGGFAWSQRRMLAGAVEFALRERGVGGRPFDRPGVRERLARAAIHSEVADAMGARSLFTATVADPAIGPMAKMFSSDRFIEDAADLIDLCAPDSLIEGTRGGHATGASAVEFAYRLSTATSIYGGTSEIMKSIVAQASLGLPRSRS